MPKKIEKYEYCKCCIEGKRVHTAYIAEWDCT